MSNDQILDGIKYEDAVKRLLIRGWMWQADMWIAPWGAVCTLEKAVELEKL